MNAATLYQIEARYTEARLILLPVIPIVQSIHGTSAHSAKQMPSQDAQHKSLGPKHSAEKMVSIPPVWLSQRGRGSKHLRVLASLGTDL